MNDLVEEYQRGTQEAIEELWKQTRKYISVIAKKFSGIRGAEYDDLMQCGFLALTNAAQHYDKNKGDFLPFLSACLSREYRRYISGSGGVHVPEYKQVWVQRLNQAEADFLKENGRKPTEAELCKILGLSKKALQEIEIAREVNEIYSLDKSITDEGKEADLYEILPDERNEPEEIEKQTDRDRMSAVLWEIIADEGADTVYIMKMRYKEEKTLEETGAAIGWKVDKVRRHEQKCLSYIRRTGKNAPLRRYYEDYIGFYRLGGLSRFRATQESEVEAIALRHIQ